MKDDSRVYYNGIYIHKEDPEYINDFSRTLLEGHYTRKDERIPEAFGRASVAYCAGDLELAQRIYDYVYKGWFIFSSPVLSNAPKGKWVDGKFSFEEKLKGMPISCYALDIPDTIDGQIKAMDEIAELSISGGGVGAHNSIRGITDKAPGPIPYMKMIDGLIGYYRQGSCYADNVEVLTSNGYKLFKDIVWNKDVKVAQVNDDESIEFVKPIDWIDEKYSGDMVLYKDSKNIDLMVTPNHRMIFKRRKRITNKRDKNGKFINNKKVLDNNLLESRADEMPTRDIVKMHGAFAKNGHGITDYERFLIAFQADGSFLSNQSTDACSFRFAKDRKKIRLRSILEKNNFEYTESKKDGISTFYIKHKPQSKTLDWVNIDDTSLQWAKEFIEEISHWDSSIRNNGSFNYSSIIERNVDIIQAIASMAGMKSNKTVDFRESEPNKSTIYNIFISEGNHWGNGGSLSKEICQYNGNIYCCTVPSGRIIVRSNGKTLVCGNSRRGAIAYYLDVTHPSINEHIRFRVSGGDRRRRSDNIKQFHNAGNLTDEFIQSVFDDKEIDLACPHSGKIYETVKARKLWEDMIETRALTGEPYMFKIDLANRMLPESQKHLGLKIHGSNLCSEISLPTNNNRTIVCALSSPNVEYFEQWKNTSMIQDLAYFIDNVIQYFIENASDILSKAAYSAMRERAMGIGQLGWHSFLQSKMIPIESGGINSAVQWANIIQKHIYEEADKASRKMAIERGESPDMEGTGRRNSRLIAIAPNSNSSDIIGSSPGIEPWYRNVFVKDTRVGSHQIKNKHLEKLLEEKGRNTKEIWDDINAHNGSVQHLDFLSDHEKKVFKTAMEIDQHWLVELADQRGKYVDQAQSLNLFFMPGASREYVNSVHLKFLKAENVVSLYYYRTERNTKVDTAKDIERKALSDWQGEECVSCQG